MYKVKITDNADFPGEQDKFYYVSDDIQNELKKLLETYDCDPDSLKSDFQAFDQECQDPYSHCSWEYYGQFNISDTDFSVEFEKIRDIQKIFEEIQDNHRLLSPKERFDKLSYLNAMKAFVETYNR